MTSIAIGARAPRLCSKKIRTSLPASTSASRTGRRIEMNGSAIEIDTSFVSVASLPSAVTRILADVVVGPVTVQ